jgi:hypothetical protein
MGLLPLAEDAEGVVCSTATAWFGSVTLPQGQCISFDLLMRIVQGQEVRGPALRSLCLPWIFSVYSDRRPYILACGRRYLNASSRTMALIGALSLCCVYGYI